MIAEQLSLIRDTLPEGTKLVAVSKYYPAEAITEAYGCGQRIFGESRVQELLAKHEALPKDIEWHFIGHLQTNKVKYIAPFVAMIHAVDSFKLLAEISRQAGRAGRVIPCLLQLHVAQEETKFGFTPDECLAMLEEGAWRNLKGVSIAGMMCMASNTNDQERVTADFALAHNCFLTARQRFFPQSPTFIHCSWGMSNDYRQAIGQGATIVRIGSLIFGDA